MEYAPGIEYGIWEDYFETGQLKTRAQYQEGFLHGTWTYYRADGSLELLIIYENGERVG